MAETHTPSPKHTLPSKMTQEDHDHDHHHHHHLDEKPLHGGATPSRNYRARDPRRALTTFILVFLILAGIVALIVWLVYRPHKPKFTVVGAAVYELNTSSPPFMSTTMQFTIITRNPNKRTSLYYDHLSVFVEYKDEAITPPLIMPPLSLGKKTTMAMSPVLGGSPLPVKPEVANGLMMDADYGVVGLRLVVLGRVKYKAGAIRTRRYGLFVKCDILIGMKRGFVGQVPLVGSPGCDVDV